MPAPGKGCMAPRRAEGETPGWGRSKLTQPLSPSSSYHLLSCHCPAPAAPLALPFSPPPTCFPACCPCPSRPVSKVLASPRESWGPLDPALCSRTCEHCYCIHRVLEACSILFSGCRLPSWCGLGVSDDNRSCDPSPHEPKLLALWAHTMIKSLVFGVIRGIHSLWNAAHDGPRSQVENSVFSSVPEAVTLEG